MQPDCSSSAIAVSVDTSIISGVRCAQILYRFVSQPNSSAFCAAGTARVRLWYMWWCVFTSRDHEVAAQVEHFVGRLGQLGGRADRDDPVVFDVEPRVAQLAARVVHGHEHVGVLDQQGCRAG